MYSSSTGHVLWGEYTNVHMDVPSKMNKDLAQSLKRSAPFRRSSRSVSLHAARKPCYSQEIVSQQPTDNAICKRLVFEKSFENQKVAYRKMKECKNKSVQMIKNNQTRERERGGRERKGMLDRTDGSKQKRRRQRNFQNTGRVCRLDTVCWWSSWMTTKIGNEEKDVCQSKKQSILIRF